MTELVLQESFTIQLKQEEQPGIEHLVQGITMTIARKMNSKYPWLFVIPQDGTLSEFSNRILEEFEEPLDYNSIQDIKTHYIIFCQQLVGKDLYFPCIGPVPYHIQRKREQAAVDETFCRKEK